VAPASWRSSGFVIHHPDRGTRLHGWGCGSVLESCMEAGMQPLPNSRCAQAWLWLVQHDCWGWVVVWGGTASVAISVMALGAMQRAISIEAAEHPFFHLRVSRSALPFPCGPRFGVVLFAGLLPAHSGRLAFGPLLCGAGVWGWGGGSGGRGGIGG